MPFLIKFKIIFEIDSKSLSLHRHEMASKSYKDFPETLSNKYMARLRKGKEDIV